MAIKLTAKVFSGVWLVYLTMNPVGTVGASRITIHNASGTPFVPLLIGCHKVAMYAKLRCNPEILVFVRPDNLCLMIAVPILRSSWSRSVIGI